MAVVESALGRYEIGRVATRTFEVIRANFVSFFVLGLIATAPTTVYVAMIAAGQLPGSVIGPGVHADSRTLATYFIALFSAAIVGAFFGLILQAAVTYGTVSSLSNQPATLERALGIGVRQFLPLFAIAILEGLGLMGGFILLIVPGIMLFVMWSVVVPVRVAENKGIFACFGRSRELTKGYRWPIFGTIIVFYFGAGIAQATTRPLIAVGAAAGMSGPALVAGVIFTALVNAVVAVASATMIACIYYELRVVKEGVGPAQIAAVFD